MRGSRGDVDEGRVSGGDAADLCGFTSTAERDTRVRLPTSRGHGMKTDSKDKCRRNEKDARGEGSGQRRSSAEGRFGMQ